MIRYPWGFFHPQSLNASSQHQIIGSKDWIKRPDQEIGSKGLDQEIWIERLDREIERLIGLIGLIELIELIELIDRQVNRSIESTDR
jgi:hypothetical protein